MKTLIIIGLMILSSGVVSAQANTEKSKKIMVSSKSESQPQTVPVRTTSTLSGPKAEQAEKIENETNQKITEIQANSNLTAEEKAKEIKSIRLNQKTQLLEFLTEEEYKEYIHQGKESESITE
jgi:hypothetical protein